MFSTVIQNAKNAAEKVAGLKFTDQQPAGVVNHAKTFDTSIIPMLSEFAGDASSFVKTSTLSVHSMLSAIKSGKSPKDLTPELEKLNAALSAIIAKNSDVSAGFDSFHNEFSADSAALATFKVNIAAKAQKLSMEKTKKEAELARVNSSITAATTVISIFNPFAGALANLYVRQNALQGVISSLTSSISDVQSEIGHINSLIPQVSGLESMLSQLLQIVQNSQNALTVVHGKLSNEKQFLDATPQAAELFLNALLSSLEQLNMTVS
ncbi:MAG: hypothetical protein AAF936_17575 [Pseudomonadota bacterium]